MDFQVVQLRQVLPIARMVEVPGPPHTLVISGPASDQVTDVEVNGARGYPFQPLGDTSIEVTLPDLCTVRSLAVLGRTMGNLLEAALVLAYPTRPTTLSGMQLLVQMWVKEFLTTPGSDVFDREAGGGAGKIAGSANIVDVNITSNITIAVQRTNQSIIKRQSGNNTIPRSERLLSAEILQVSSSAADQTIKLDVEIKNQSGAIVRVGLG